MKKKAKSTSTNPFRYISFTEQISNLSAEVTKWQIALPTTTADRETFFYDSIVKFNDADYGAFYKSFLSEIPFKSGELRTYAQLLHHQKTIFDVIIKHLNIEESTSLITILELTIAFARDLREDMSPYLWDLFEAIIGLLEKADQKAELLETGFRALAVLFKLQWRKVVKELRRTFVRFERLFSSKRGYLRRFAAEAFAFLLRKSNSVGKLTVFLTERAEKDGNSSLTDGISQLYFNALKGVMRQFHSTAGQVLTEILDASLEIEEVSTRKVSITILEGAMNRCAAYTKEEYAAPVFEALRKKFISSSQQDAICLSKLLLVWVKTKKGASMPDVNGLMEALKRCVIQDNWKPDKDILKLISTAVLTYGSESSVHSAIVNTVDSIAMKVESTETKLVLEFMSDISSSPMFDVWLMPSVGKLAKRIIINMDINNKDMDINKDISGLMELYAGLCADRRPIEMGRVDRIPFFDVSSHTEFRDKILGYIKSNNMPNNDDDVMLMGCAVTSYPWLWRQADKPKDIESLVELLKWCMSCMTDLHSKLALLTSYAISLVDAKVFEEFTIDQMIEFVGNHKCDENSLRVLHIVLPNTADFGNSDRLAAFQKISKEILPCVGHWDSAVRQIALEILLAFDLPLRGFIDENGIVKSEEKRSVFSILLEAERTPLTLQDYRTRLMLLRKVSHGAHNKHMPKDANEMVETIPLRVILAQLFERFTIYWPHLFDIVDTFAYGMHINAFWPIFSEFLQNATQNLVSSIKEEGIEESSINIVDKLLGVNKRQQPDYAMFRLQMLNMLQRFDGIAERRTKFLSIMLINLYRDEYQGVDLMSRNRQNIIWRNNTNDIHQIEEDQIMDNDTENGTIEDEDMEGEENDENMAEEVEKDGSEVSGHIKRNGKKKAERSVPSTNRRMVKRTMTSLLETFSKFKAPKAVFAAKDVRELYDELLLIPDEEVQKAVLKCLFTYKYKYLNPYKENLEKVVSDRTFLNELIRFGVDAQDSAISEEHRGDVMPILMRLLYGKMQTHVANDANARRSAIFRFLAGCTPNEIDVFIRVLFAPLVHISGGTMLCDNTETQSVDEMCSLVCNSFDPSAMIPLARIKGSLNSLSHIVNKLSPSLADSQKSVIYRINLVISILIRMALESESRIHPKNVKLLKELRGMVCQRFKEIFFSFQARTFTASEIESLYKYFIVPLCDDVTRRDLVIAPLAVLRLFESWTEVPMLFYLLQVRMNVSVNKTPETPISIMCNCLLANSTSAVSKDGVIRSIINLITLADEKNDNIPQDLDLVQVERREELNLGTALILSELPKLLTFISDSLPRAEEKKKLNLKHLEILSRLGEYVTDSSIGERLATTLLTYVQLGAIKSEEALNSLLNTVARLLPTVGKPIEFLQLLVQQFSTIKARTSRDALCGIVESLAKCQQAQGRLENLLNCVCDLNAWDPRRIDEPDHEKRHTAYNVLNQVWESGEIISTTVIQMIAHSHYFTITESSDISLKSAASTNLRRQIEYLGVCSMNEEDRIICLEGHLLPLVLKGLHSEVETIRHEFVNALVSLLVAFPNHKELKHLVQLRNIDDLDLDFYDNIAHIQIHRRQRAFRRLTDNLMEKEVKIPVEILLKYFLPLAQPYIVNFTSKTSALSDEAIRLLSYVLSVSPWKRYYPMLDFYLKRLQRENVNQKANVRVIVAIIDAFHFDISSDEDKDGDWQTARKPVRPTENLDPDVVMKEAEPEGDTVMASGDTVDPTNTTVGGSLNIRKKVLEHLLPRLKDCVVGKDLHSHRKAQVGKHFSEDDDIQRAPIALATVKLLNKMPQAIIDQHLHGVVIKLCNLLMSRSINVREVARRTLISVVEALGPKYLPFVIREMKVTLIRGYQVHVMIFSVHALISSMQALLNPKDLDPCLNEIIEVCNMDLFGDTADEKSVTGITKDVPEAKANRTFDTYSMIGRFVGAQCLGMVLKPLKEVIESRPTAKTITTVGQLLRHFAMGLCTNEGIEASTMLIFAYQTLSANIGEVLARKGPSGGIKREGEGDLREGARPKSCLLLEKEPTRLGVIVKTSVKSRMHVFVEFGLQIMASTMKSNKLDSENNEDIAKLDPFVNIVSQCLELKYDKVISNALRCFISLLKYPLPSLNQQMQIFVDRLFILLSDYASMGNAGNKGVVIELNQLLFKAFTHMIKDAPTLILSPKRLQLLLNYVETDVTDSQKQATAFPLIKAIISRKLQDDKITELIQYLSELSITSDLAHIRTQCRQVLIQFIGNHPQSKKPKHYVDFYLAQLEYEYEDGRVSAIEMINSLFDSFTQKANDQYCLLALVSLGVRLVNEESGNCRKMISMAIRKLLESVSESKLNDAYLATRDWLQANKETSRSIAMQVLVEFAWAKCQLLSGKLGEIIPLINTIIDGGIISEYAEINTVNIIDSLAIIVGKCSVGMKQMANEGLLNDIIKSLEPFIKCIESSPIQLSSARLIGQLLFALELEYFKSHLNPTAKTLADWACFQLKSRTLQDDLAQQAAKNVVFLSDALADTDELHWLCAKLCSICKFEVVQQPGEALKRSTVFKLAAALAMRRNEKELEIVTDAFMPSLHREMMGKSSQRSEELQQVATEVGDIFRERLGEEKFNQKLGECQKLAMVKSERRKREQKEEAVLDPANAALRKQKKNKAKTEARKRKLDQDKPYRTSIRKRMRDMES